MVGPHRPTRTWSGAAVTLLIAATVVGVSGCAARASRSLADRFVRGVGQIDQQGADEGLADRGVTPAQPPAVPRAVPPPVTKTAVDLTIEGADEALEAALAWLATEAGGAAHRAVAAEYRRLGVFDRAVDYLSRAIAIDRKDAEAFEARAQVWRDWGLPQFGLGDAVRARYLAPQSAGVHNTFATLLFALGQVAAAEESLDLARALDPGAAWVRSNLCYLAFLRGDGARAESECRAALELDPALPAARNNLGLVYAAVGRLDDARQAFEAAGGGAVGHYNLGVVHLARRDYERAAEAFDAALREAPEFQAAFVRAREARRLAEAGSGR